MCVCVCVCFFPGKMLVFIFILDFNILDVLVGLRIVPLFLVPSCVWFLFGFLFCLVCFALNRMYRYLNGVSLSR